MRRAMTSAGGLTLTVLLLVGLSIVSGPVLPVARAQSSAAQSAAPDRAQRQSAPRVVNRRDPFRSLLVGPDDVTGGRPLPPGKRGLVISQLTIVGVVSTPSEKIAVVNMRGKNRAYFLREGDEVFDGSVNRITEDGVLFKERAKDAFGKQYERDVVKSLFGSGAQR